MHIIIGYIANASFIVGNIANTIFCCMRVIAMLKMVCFRWLMVLMSSFTVILMVMGVNLEDRALHKLKEIFHTLVHMLFKYVELLLQLHNLLLNLYQIILNYFILHLTIFTSQHQSTYISTPTSTSISTTSTIITLTQ